MKRLLVLCAALLSATAASAEAADRDVLVTPGGVVYTVESMDIFEPGIPASRTLLVTVQNGDEKYTNLIPESTLAGRHTLPALAYDADTDTLFVLWMHMPNMMSSELLLGSYRHGAWQTATSLDNQPYRLRQNLHLGITRRVAQLQPDGSYQDASTLLLHVLWWEETGAGEEARYALVPIEKGHVTTPEIHSMSEFANRDSLVAPVDPAANLDVLTHPVFLDNGTANSIDVLFGDLKTQTFQRVPMKPVLDARVRIPVGKNPGGPIGMANVLSTPEWSGPITVIGSPHNDRLVFARTAAGGVVYVTYSGGSWSSVRTIATDSKLTPDVAISALAKMLNAD